jgi:hypothetical protein
MQLCDWGSQYLSMPHRLGSWLAETLLTALTERRAVMASNVMSESFFIIFTRWKRNLSQAELRAACRRFSRAGNFALVRESP